MLYPKRYVASVLLEANTPLSISSGEKSLLTDAVIMTDANGLPMIPGTSLTGVLRHGLLLDDPIKDDIFGYQKDKENEGSGSRLIVSNANFVGKDGKVIEALYDIDWDDEFYRKFNFLPVRQHTRISHQGAASSEQYGKFDEQVVYKGTRFRFELELLGTKEDQDHWNLILNLLDSAQFRIGGGTRKGFGEIESIEIIQKCFDLKQDLDPYLKKTASLNNLKHLTKFSSNNESRSNWIHYKINIQPENLWIFSSGLSDDESDIVPVYEEEIQWENDTPSFSNKKLLIPASALKGAISHRVAYHYNMLSNQFADQLLKDERDNIVAENNNAVKTLFGFALKDNQGQRGKVLFSDILIESNDAQKILNHVTIDRFTGGTIDGALFDEKVIQDSQSIAFTICVDQSALQDEPIKQSLELTLDDICSGMLPLGGGVMRGHGCFNGKWEIINDK